MKATRVLAGDWEGLYIDGKLYAEGHSLRASDVLDALDIPTETVTVDEEWMEDEGQLPDSLKDVKAA